MSDPMLFDGKEYISSKRASELSGYAQDYIGQLARKGLIDARRVGGLWFISMSSLTEYKSNTDAQIKQQPERKESQEASSLVSFDGKDYVSASRAAEITGYHADYVGQLARSGTIISRQVGNRWYIDREAILAHKQEKDSLLGAVQAQSVGISRNDTTTVGESVPVSHYGAPEPLFTYTSDDRDLVPVLNSVKDQEPSSKDAFRESERTEFPTVVPIRVIEKQKILHHSRPVKHVKSNVGVPRKTIYKGAFRNLAAVALTVVIVLSFSFVTLRNSSIYATESTPSGSLTERGAFTAGAASAVQWIENFLQNFLVKELFYKRVDTATQ